MSRNGSGTYTLPAGNPVVTGTTITSSWANTTMQNIADGLTQSVASDGQTPMSGALNMGTNKINNLGTPAVSTDAATKAYVDLTQTASGITGGTITGATLTNDTIDSTPIGSTTPSTVKTTALTVTGATSGTLAIAATAIAGTNTATFPAATGTVMVSGNMPAFSAYLGSTQSVSAGVTTKVQFNTINFDTNSNYNTTNYRFTPTVSGYYQINAGVTMQQVTNGGYITIYKNGVGYATNSCGAYTGNTYPAPCVASIIFLNGSTDYVEIYITTTASGSVNLGVSSPMGTNDASYFNGSLIRR